MMEPSWERQLQRFICIHGHFYQPPRENPWLEASSSRTPPIPTTTGTSASPPSATRPTPTRASSTTRAASPRIVNNYSRISFNFGPTLLGWLEENDARDLPGDPRGRPPQPRAVLRSRLGHGPGLQPHDLPLATRGTSAPRCSGGFATSSTVRPRARGHVAAGDRGRPGVPGGAGRPGHPLHHPRAPPGRARRDRWGPRVAGRAADGSDRSQDALRGEPARRAGRSRSSSTTARSPARSPSSVCSPTARPSPTGCSGAFDDSARRAPAGPHRHRRRDLRPPPPLRRHGPGLRAAPHREQASWPGSPTTASTWSCILPPTRWRSTRSTAWSCAHGVGRWRTTAAATPARDPAGTSAGAPRCARRWTGCGTSWPRCSRNGGRTLLHDPWAGAGRLHRGDPRPLGRDRGALPRPATPGDRWHAERTRPRAAAAGAPAPRAC